MKTLYKLYVLIGESWECSGSFDNLEYAENCAQVLRNLGHRTMIRRVQM